MLLSEIFVGIAQPKSSLKPAKRLARKKATAERKAVNATKARKKKLTPKKRVDIKHHVPTVKAPKLNSIVKKAKNSLTRE